MSLLDANGRKIELNPQPLVTAEILKKFNANFLHDLHRLKKSYFVRPADAKKPQTVGEKLLNALKSVGHAVRSLIYSSKNAENRLYTRFAKLHPLVTNQNIKCSSDEYRAVLNRIRENFNEIIKLHSFAKEEQKPLLCDCLKFYKNLAKNFTEKVVQTSFGYNGSTELPKGLKEILKTKLDALEKDFLLPSETKNKQTIPNPSKAMFGKVKPPFINSDGYVYYDD